MNRIIYILTAPFLLFIALLPFWVLYRFSTLLYVLFYHVVGYRKKVVRGNLELVFPNKPEKEINRIEKEFYKHMCDMFLETVKTMSLSKEALAPDILPCWACTKASSKKEKGLMPLSPER